MKVNLVASLCLLACGRTLGQTDAPTASPTEAPTEAPTASPTDAPTPVPTVSPTASYAYDRVYFNDYDGNPCAEPPCSYFAELLDLHSGQGTQNLVDLISNPGIGGDPASNEVALFVPPDTFFDDPSRFPPAMKDYFSKSNLETDPFAQSVLNLFLNNHLVRGTSAALQAVLDGVDLEADGSFENVPTQADTTQNLAMQWELDIETTAGAGGDTIATVVYDLGAYGTPSTGTSGVDQKWGFNVKVNIVRQESVMNGNVYFLDGPLIPNYRQYLADMVETVKMVNAGFFSPSFVDPITFGRPVSTTVRVVEEAFAQSPALVGTLNGFDRFSPTTGYLPADAAFDRLDVGMMPFLLSKSEDGTRVMDDLVKYGFVSGLVLTENPDIRPDGVGIGGPGNYDSYRVQNDLISGCLDCNSPLMELSPADQATCEQRGQDNYRFDEEGVLDDSAGLCGTSINSRSIIDLDSTFIQANCLGETGAPTSGDGNKPCFRDASNMLISGAYFKACGDPNEELPAGAPNHLSCITNVRATNGALHIIDRALPFDPLSQDGSPGVEAPTETLIEVIKEDDDNDRLECAVAWLDAELSNFAAEFAPLAPAATFVDVFEATQSACGRVLDTTPTSFPKCGLDCRINNAIAAALVEIGARTGCNEGPGAPCSSRESAFGASNNGNLGSAGGAIGTCDNGYTVFSPQDDNWLNFPAGVREFLLVSTTAPEAYANLRLIVLNHISEITANVDNTILYAGDIADYLALNETDRPDITSAAGEVWNITDVDGAVFVNGVPVIGVDDPAMNGVKHEVGGILFPEQLRDPERWVVAAPTPRSAIDSILKVVEDSSFYTWNGNFNFSSLDAALDCETRFPEVLEVGTCDRAHTFFRPNDAAVTALQGAGEGTTTDALTYIQNHADIARKFIEAHVMVDTPLVNDQFCVQDADARENCITNRARCLVAPDAAVPFALSAETLYEKPDGSNSNITIAFDITLGPTTPTIEGEVYEGFRDPIRTSEDRPNAQVWRNNGAAGFGYFPALNGMVHDIEKVIIPADVYYPFDLAAIAEQRSTIDASGISTFMTLLGTVDALEGAAGAAVYPELQAPAGHHVLLAPTNAAFAAAFTPGQIAYLSSELGVNDLSNVMELHLIEDIGLTNTAGTVGALLAAGSAQVLGDTLLGAPNVVNIVPPSSSEDGGFCVEVDNSAGDRACTTMPEVDTINGWIHEMDGVLLPEEAKVPQLPTSTLLALATALNDDPDNGVFLGTLLELLAREEADAMAAIDGRIPLVDILDDAAAGPFTVFLPTDLAFSSFSDQLTTVINDIANVDTLRSFLEYHVLVHNEGDDEVSPILGTQYCARLFDAGEYTTLDRDLKVRSAPKEDGTILLEGLFNEGQSNVLNCQPTGVTPSFTGDNPGINGVVHTVDAVLVPEEGLNYEGPLPSSKSSGLGAGAIAGIVIGSIAGLGLISYGAVKVKRAHQRDEAFLEVNEDNLDMDDSGVTNSSELPAGNYQKMADPDDYLNM